MQNIINTVAIVVYRNAENNAARQLSKSMKQFFAFSTFTFTPHPHPSSEDAVPFGLW